MHRYLSRAILITLVTCLMVVIPVAADAAYNVGFKSGAIEITSPKVSGFDAEGVMEIAGKAGVDRVWICLRGPNGEIETVPLDVSNGDFKGQIWLRFGAGKYTVWAGNDAYHFDGKIRFEVLNRFADEVRYLAPSAYVDSDHPEIVELARSLTNGLMTNTEKAKAIHEWVTANVAYDYTAYLNGDRQEIARASEGLAAKEGLCRDYAFLTAAFARAAELPARVVYGQARSNPGWDEPVPCLERVPDRRPLGEPGYHLGRRVYQER